MKFREHRGSLSNSLSTLVEVKDFAGLVQHIKNLHLETNIKIEKENLKIESYFDKRDPRTKWEKTFKVILEGYDGVIGFTDSK